MLKICRYLLVGCNKKQKYISRCDMMGKVSDFFRGKLCCTHREIFTKSYQIKQKTDFIYNFLINLEPNGRLLGSKSIGKL